MASNTVVEKRRLVGGYQPVKDIDDEGVRHAAQFAVQELRRQDTPGPYSFDLPAEIAVENIKIVRAFYQVVAGLNYRLVLALVNDDATTTASDGCMGAFAVTVYDHFGDLSVTNWGKEIDCAAAMAALENDDLDDALAEHFNG